MKKRYSFGIIPIYKGEDSYYFLAVKNTKGEHWGLPKGTPKEGEKPKETAYRELEEETGIKDIELLDTDLAQETYIFEKNGEEYEKTNTYYAGFVNSMDVGSDLDEIDELKWVKFGDEDNSLSYKETANVIKDLAKHLGF